MARESSRNESPRPPGIPRREFIKLAAVAGLLAGCRPSRQVIVTATPTATPVPTNTPTPTPAPSLTPTPIAQARQPEIIKMYPDVPSRVVHTHHAGVWDGDTLMPEAIQQMLDASITELTGLSDATAAWAAMFDPDERIAIKVNTIFSEDCTHIPLVMAVTECLQEAGVPAEQIIVFDRDMRELRDAGYSINKDGPGVRCYGTNYDYTAGWAIGDTNIRLSDILLNCDALINIPILTGVVFAGMGISFAMKNHFGTFDRPSHFHDERFERGVVELNALPPIKERTRLIIGDILTAETYRSYFGRYVIGGDKILMSFDPVAHDTVGMQIATEAYAAEGLDSTAVTAQATPWLARSTELGLGTNDPDYIELVEVSLG
jgi:hypothetical protein